MKASILGVAMAMLLVAPAMAQTSQANSQSGATASSGSRSFAATGSSSASVTQIYNMGPSDPSGSSSSGDPSGDPSAAADPPPTTTNVNYGGGYTVHNTPDVIPPSWGGQNVCAVGASGGVSVAGFGVSLGGMWSDSGCERRNSAVVLYQMGQHKAAVALMCQDPHVATAMQAAGDPCPGAARAVSMTTPSQTVRPASATVQHVAAVTPAHDPVCRMVFHYPTFPDGKPNPNGAGWMQRECS